MPELTALGSSKTDYRYNSPSAATLETFDNPMPKECEEAATGTRSVLHIEVPEFTSLCPKTGQPDFAKIVIDYEPADKCVESKSLKLYLMQYRNEGMFHEACVAKIAHDLFNVMNPLYLRVEGQFSPRGGIPFWPTVELFRN